MSTILDARYRLASETFESHYISPEDRADYSLAFLEAFDREVATEIADVTIALSAVEDWRFSEEGRGTTPYELVQLLEQQIPLIPDHIFDGTPSINEYANRVQAMAKEALRADIDICRTYQSLYDLCSMRSKVIPRNREEILRLIKIHRDLNKLKALLKFCYDVEQLKRDVHDKDGTNSWDLNRAKTPVFQRLTELSRELDGNHIPAFRRALSDFEELKDVFDLHKSMNAPSFFAATHPSLVPSIAPTVVVPAEKKRNFYGHICVPLLATAAVVLACAAIYRQIYLK